MDKVKQRIEEYISQLDLEKVELGSYKLKDGDYVNVVEYCTKEINEYLFEKHEKFIDGFYVVSGEEIVLCATQGEMVKEYSPEKEASFYKTDEYETFELQAGCLLVIPTDVLHCPALALDKSQKVRKAIFKISIENA